MASNRKLVIGRARDAWSNVPLEPAVGDRPGLRNGCRTARAPPARHPPGAASLVTCPDFDPDGFAAPGPGDLTVDVRSGVHQHHPRPTRRSPSTPTPAPRRWTTLAGLRPGCARRQRPPAASTNRAQLSPGITVTGTGTSTIFNLGERPASARPPRRVEQQRHHLGELRQRLTMSGNTNTSTTRASFQRGADDDRDTHDEMRRRPDQFGDHDDAVDNSGAMNGLNIIGDGTNAVANRAGATITSSFTFRRDGRGVRLQRRHASQRLLQYRPLHRFLRQLRHHRGQRRRAVGGNDRFEMRAETSATPSISVTATTTVSSTTATSPRASTRAPATTRSTGTPVLSGSLDMGSRRDLATMDTLTPGEISNINLDGGADGPDRMVWQGTTGSFAFASATGSSSSLQGARASTWTGP